jgi:hypothetical protein
MDTKEIGELSEAKVLVELKSLGFTVSTPFGDNAKYDLIFDDGSSLHKVQVKTGRLKDRGVVSFNTATRGHNTDNTYQKEYTEEDIDVFVVYCPQNENLYAVDVEDAPNSSMSLRVEEPGNGQTKGINMAEDFRLTERFK